MMRVLERLGPEWLDFAERWLEHRERWLDYEKAKEARLSKTQVLKIETEAAKEDRLSARARTAPARAARRKKKAVKEV